MAEFIGFAITIVLMVVMLYVLCKSFD